MACVLVSYIKGVICAFKDDSNAVECAVRTEGEIVAAEVNEPTEDPQVNNKMF